MKTRITVGILIGVMLLFLVVVVKQETKEVSNQQEEQQKEQQEEFQTQEQTKIEEKPVVVERDIPEIQGILQDFIIEKNGINENWAVYVKSLKDERTQQVGNINAMKAASLIKLYIMGAVYENYDKIIEKNGKETVDSMLHTMITISDNGAANSLTNFLGEGSDEVGRKVVNEYCMNHGYKNTFMGRTLLQSNEYGDNFTSVKDCGLLLERIYNKEIDYADEMLELLKQQERRWKIPAGVPKEVETANKTGELSDVENDIALVFESENPYILCVMSENLTSPYDARQTIIRLSSNIYEELKE